MGCATSKQKPVCRNCRAPCSPIRRSYSVHVHHPPLREGDTYHVVALTSTTLGSLKLDSINHNNEEKINPIKDEDEKRNREFSMGLIEAKTWSNMINQKIPKIVPRTPITTPPGEPETIDAWELMEGLEDTSPLRPPHHIRSFSFNVSPNSIPSPFDLPTLKPRESVDQNQSLSLKPMWLDVVENELNSNSNSNSNATSIISEFDPDVISTFRKSLEDLPLANPFHLPPIEDDQSDLEVREVKSKERVVLYFTSLRGVRKTYEDCCHVRVILKGIGVRVDERDVSMHSGFKEELRELLGDGFNGGGLPRVFLGKKYIGGAEEIRRMHEEGQLEKLLLECCEMVEDGGSGSGGGGGGVCEGCGDIRFVPCETCSGSCKIYYEDDDDDDYDESEYGFQRCPDCNENGIIRCPFCCD